MNTQPENILSGRDLLAAFFTLVVAAILVCFPLSDPDVYWHIANGREMLSQGRIINEEVFSYTALGTPFSNHEWLSQILWFVVYNLGEGEALNYLKIALSLCIVGFLYPTCRFTGASPFLAALVCIAAILGGLPRYTPRPELFSLLGVSVLGFLFHAFRTRRIPANAMYVLPIVMVVWDWLHGAIFGVVLLSAYVVGENARHWLSQHTIRFLPTFSTTELLDTVRLRTLNFAVLATIAAMFINPWGLSSYGIFFAFLGSNPMVAAVKEFQVTTWEMNPAFWVFFAVAVLAFIGDRKRIDLTHLFLVLPFAYLALRYARGMGVFSLVAAPVVASALSHQVRQRFDSVKSRQIVVGLLSMTAIGIGGYSAYIKAFSPDWLWRFSTTERKDGFPLGSVNFVKEVGLQGNMYNSGNLGGYLSFFVTPERNIFQYNHHTVFRDNYRYMQNPRELDRWNINYAIVDVWDELPHMFPRTQWAPVYNEQSVAVVVRRIPENQPIIDAYEIQYYQPHRLTYESLSRFASNPMTHAKIMREMANYLAFREDLDMANLFVEYLQAAPMSPEPYDRNALLQRAAQRNGKNAKILNALRVTNNAREGKR